MQIMISPELLKMKGKNAANELLKNLYKYATDKEHELIYDLIIFTPYEKYNYYNSFSFSGILHTMKITSNIKNGVIGFNLGLHVGNGMTQSPNLAEFGNCELVTKDNKIIKASFILIKKSATKNVFDLHTNHKIIEFDLFRENIIQVSTPRKLEMKLYQLIPYDKIIKLNDIFDGYIRENRGVPISIYFKGPVSTKKGCFIEIYDQVSKIE